MIEYPRLTADLVVLTIRDDRLKVLLVVRGRQPFKGRLALPGGFLEHGESLEETAARELFEETGLDADRLHLKPTGIYSDPERDPRSRVITVSYLAIAPNLEMPSPGDEILSTDWYEVDDDLYMNLAFDHARILEDALEQARALLEQTSIGTTFCKEPFTISELRRVYEIIMDIQWNQGNFQNKVLGIEGFLEYSGEKGSKGPGRPGKLYRAGPVRKLNGLMKRPKTAGTLVEG
ncbi:NUDIX domain-containing protein [Glycomyces mayteni]|uniref:NUDIX domain-containing protein n=2 Tax=Glycomyces mayteni TaxID=543887 RepID=A0ABW2D5A8_9ACTN